ncbi:hypothetical protein AC578_10005 [Pseudocercospora eumusae]|uniref:HMG box domain-containing protein n=1 Tax=Pseudocercospora eumusae TaxID=321146 RepID=A0A139HM67_9PEZI|nr:hypothetical protein AC578_10005 [Pseudocercospora eumusae]
MLPRVLLRFHARLPRSLLQPKHGLNPNSSIVLPIRTYATPGRPKSVVGEPSRPVKRNVKKSVAKPRDASSAAEKKPASKKRKRRITPEQVAAKKQKEAAKKEAMKEAAKKRQAAKRAAHKASAEKEMLQGLKTAALDPPKQRSTSSAWITFISEKTKATKESIPDKVKAISAEFKNLSAADREYYNHLAHTKNEEQHAIFKRWVESHTPGEIQKANGARSQLRKMLPSQKIKWAKIEDERVPKKPAGPFAVFTGSRRGSGDFKGIKMGDAAKLVAQEWKAMSSSEKEKYDKIYKDNLQRYVSEYSNVFGHPPRYIPVADAEATAAV